ncbi:MAG: hypothetical protein WD904_09930 [Dehalococcoidia bacterium]
MSAFRNSKARRPWAIIAGLAIASIAVVILGAASVWQSGIRDSKLNEAEPLAARAALLEEAGREGDLSVQLLRQYVASGDASLLIEMQSHSTIAIRSLTQAVPRGGGSELDAISEGREGLAESAGQVVALRMAGDVEGANAILEGITPTLDQLTMGLQNATAEDLNEVSSLQASADNADKLANWLGGAAITIGLGVALIGIILVFQAAAKRREPGTASS